MDDYRKKGAWNNSHGIIPTASVLIPAYNVEKYLRRALDSVINQTYKNFEIILINDGSTDSTPQICDEYGKKYDFIHVYHQTNMGLSKTRERLLEKVNGKYIFWLDSDDYYENTLIEKAIKALETEDADVASWGIVRIEINGEKIYNFIDDIGAEEWKKVSRWGMYPGVLLYASKKEMWDDWEKFPDDVDLLDDVWITSQIIPKAKKIVALEEALYYYDFTNMESISHHYSAKNLCRAGIAFYRIIKKNLKEDSKAIPLRLDFIRKLLVNSYSINQIDRSLTNAQTDLIKAALKDLDNLYPQKKMKKFYFIQFCVIHGIDFYCRIYGKGRLKRFKQK